MRLPWRKRRLRGIDTRVLVVNAARTVPRRLLRALSDGRDLSRSHAMLCAQSGQFVRADMREERGTIGTHYLIEHTMPNRKMRRHGFTVPEGAA